MASAARLRSEAQIVIAGAGSIGCFIGGSLALAGRRVIFLGRPRIAQELQQNGLHLTDLEGLETGLPPERLTIVTEPEILAGADLVLVTVKSGGTAAMAEIIATQCASGTVVLSLQNGVGNVPLLRERLPGMTVLGGTVECNVLHKGDGRFHRGTSGGLVIEARREDLHALLTVPHLRMRTTGDLTSLQWGKLLINLNNALNALSGLPLREQLLDRQWRRLLADQLEEALRVTRAAGIKPMPLPMPPALMSKILRLPTPLFRLLAASALRIDPEARSSMWEDLMLRRTTEVRQLQGEVVVLGKRHGVLTPLCSAVASLVEQAEAAGGGPPGLRPDAIRMAASE